MTYLGTALDFLFGCHHNNLSRVFTIGKRSYKVCCDCGAEFEYSLETMSMQQGEFRRPAVRSLVNMRNTPHRVWPDAA